jgi:hypothetical protein
LCPDCTCDRVGLGLVRCGVECVVSCVIEAQATSLWCALHLAGPAVTAMPRDAHDCYIRSGIATNQSLIGNPEIQ